MNPGGFVATLILSAIALRIRATRTDPRSGRDRVARQGLLLVAVIVPVLGLALPFVPWRLMAAVILTSTIVVLACLLPADSSAS